MSVPPTSHDCRAEGGILIGNQLDKDQVTHPIARRMVAGFDGALMELITAIQPPPASVHEVGCGEGRLSRRLRARLGLTIRASDFSQELIAENQARADDGVGYVARSIYDLDPGEDRAELVVCCEVLEHVERPADALAALRRLEARDYVISVPREPLWRVLNVARGKYLGALGNTPGHLNHWSVREFTEFLAQGSFEVQRCLTPLPWTMVRARLLR